ncbi:MAG: 30S ribosomal protein S17 [Candidatus Omnitrophota bacterium]|jgi:small subunit ribosomal protein S17|nr:MAG: 30S ribosomal protein S17 [Candidatus Omnitrophota bacterium]
MGRRKEFRGIVVSDKMEKTIIVRVTRLAKHPKYRRITKKCNKYKVHDELRQAKVGDEVRILETRPLSKDKRFRLVEILKKAQVIQSELKE